MKTTNIAIITLLLGALAFTSCELQNKIEGTRDLATSAEDQSLLENEFSTLYNTVNDQANRDGEISGKSGVDSQSKNDGWLPECATATFVGATKTLTIDFGEQNCACKDGRLRRGKIITVFEGKYRTQGSTATTTLENYFVNDIQFTGTKVTTNLGNASGNFKYSYKVSDASAITENGTIFWETEATIERIEGDDTFTPWDDVYLTNGSSQGTNRRGVAYTVTNTSPLKRKIEIGCARHFISGALNLETENDFNLVLDYDPEQNEACDALASVSINGGEPFTITLR